MKRKSGQLVTSKARYSQLYHQLSGQIDCKAKIFVAKKKVRIKNEKSKPIITFLPVVNGLLIDTNAQKPISPIVKTDRVEVVAKE